MGLTFQRACQMRNGFNRMDEILQAIAMRNQRNLLTVLGCSGSAALILSLNAPASAMPINAQDSETQLNPVVQSESNPIQEALECGCATCTMGKIQSF